MRALRIAGATALLGTSLLAGDDLLVGLGGNDLLCGGRGSDGLLGGPGDDRLETGPGLRDQVSWGRPAATTSAR